MSQDLLARTLVNLRGTDSNSLLRMYDQANEIMSKSPSQVQRTRADKASSRIVKELQRRHVTL
jgi:tRNA U54 and U55 pseudouridine synthase Pus10